MMTTMLRRPTLSFCAILLAFGVSAGVYAAAQNTNQDDRPFRGRGAGGPGRFGGPGGPMGPMAMLPPLPPTLNLTDAQREQIKAITSAHQDEWKAIAERERGAHEAVMAALLTDPVDDNAIRARSAEAAAVEADALVARAHARAEVFQILTADQKAQLAQMLGSRGSRGSRGSTGSRGSQGAPRF